MKTITIILFSLITLFHNPETNNPERKALLDDVFLLLENNIANPEWLNSTAYEVFKSEMYSETVMAMNDEEFLTFFKSKRHTLPFSHFDLYSKAFLNEVSANSKGKPAISWEEMGDDIAYLKVRTFVVDAKPMVKALSEIGTNKYKHLIIDLRDNTGGSLDAPVVLGRFLTQKPIDAGVYLNRKWFLKNGRSATNEDVASFPFLKDFTYQGIGRMYASEEAFRMVLPGHNQPTFEGKVYVLINSNTASAGEPLIDLLQKENLATLVGTPSAGHMLSGKRFKINDNYTVFLPIADYQTADGTRLDKVGVTPEHKVRSEEALDYVLKLLNQ